MKYSQILLLSALLLISCSQSHADSGTSSAPLKIGVIAPLSGGWKSYWDRIDYGLQAFRSDNQMIPMEFIYQDEGTCDPSLGLRAYQQLRLVHKIEIFIVVCMTTVRTILPLAKRDRVLLISIGFQERDLFQMDAQLVNFAMQIDSEAEALSRLLMKQGIRKLALIRTEGTDAFLQRMRERLSTLISSPIIYDEAFDGKEQNFAAVVSRLRKLQPDGLFINLSEPQFVTILKELQRQKVNVPLFSSYGIEGLCKGNLELSTLARGLRYTFPSLSDDSVAFDRKIADQFKGAAVINSYFAYDALTFLWQVIQACGEKDISCQFQQLANDVWRDGLAGAFLISKNGEITRQFITKQIGN